ncbi:hypothetical protein VE04_10203, partial [Pseudogymnoascus sp. 24MN13]
MASSSDMHDDAGMRSAVPRSTTRDSRIPRLITAFHPVIIVAIDVGLALSQGSQGIHLS